MAVLISTALFAGCVNTPGDVDAASVDLGTGSDLAPVTSTTEGDIMLSAGTPLRTVNYGGTYSAPLERPENATGYVIELEWTPTTPASEKLSLWIRDATIGNVPPEEPTDVVMTAEPLATARGASPLRIALPADAFDPDVEYDILVRGSDEGGAAANQAFTLHVTTFAGLPFDDAFSALGAEHAESR